LIPCRSSATRRTCNTRTTVDSAFFLRPGSIVMLVSSVSLSETIIAGRPRIQTYSLLTCPLRSAAHRCNSWHSIPSLCLWQKRIRSGAAIGRVLDCRRCLCPRQEKWLKCSRAMYPHHPRQQKIETAVEIGAMLSHHRSNYRSEMSLIRPCKARQ